MLKSEKCTFLSAPNLFLHKSLYVLVQAASAAKAAAWVMSRSDELDNQHAVGEGLYLLLDITPHPFIIPPSPRD